MQIVFSGHLGSLSSLIVILKIELLKPVLGVVAGAGHRWTWFGHVSRSSGLANTILQGTVKGKRKKRRTEEVGRQYQRVGRNGLCQLN